MIIRVNMLCWLYLLYMAAKYISTVPKHCIENEYIPSSTGPRIRGLSMLWRGKEQPDIKCEAKYYPNRVITFTWELVRRNGDVITLPGFSVKLNYRYGSYCSALNYTLSTDDIQSMLRCIARVDDETHGICEAKKEKRIHSYGKYDDKVF